MCNEKWAEGRQNMVDDAVQRAVEAERVRVVCIIQKRIPPSRSRRNTILEITQEA